MERRGFLKIVLAGLAAAPVAAAAKTTSFKETDDVRVKKWEHDGIKFAEWTLPTHVPPHFEDSKKELMATVGGVNQHLRVAKRYVIPVFHLKENTPKRLGALAKQVLQHNKATGPSMPVVKDGKYLGTEDPKHFVVVRVKGRPNLVGLGAFHMELSPVSDFYHGLEIQS